MFIVGVHKHHDGAVADLVDGTLMRYLESQKAGGARYSTLTTHTLLRAAEGWSSPPQVVATAGWFDGPGGYHGHSVQDAFVGLDEASGTRWFHTTHERAHAFCAYGLSPYPQGQPCYLLIWEGDIGSFYFVDSQCNLRVLARPMACPGHKYSFIYELADKESDGSSCGMSYGVAGKLMALAGIDRPSRWSDEDQRLVDRILCSFDSERDRKAMYRETEYWNVGPTAGRFRALARLATDHFFEIFERAALEVVTDRLPLLVSGGCGLNCEWNSRWRACGLFSDVFIPPCTDDSGIALGAAIDAQRHFTGSAKLSWSIDCGEEFERDLDSPPEGFVKEALDMKRLAVLLAGGAVVGWVQGRMELGPRALGHRSILAAPFLAETTTRLNAIKQREAYRPIAPVCREEELGQHFSPAWPSPYMLSFQRVVNDRLRAVTHTDGTARAQTVTASSHPALYALLTECAQETGVGVLCNTSLNFRQQGFINSLSELARFASQRGLDGFVVNEELYWAAQSR